jgi:hypothetical protein
MVEEFLRREFAGHRENVLTLYRQADYFVYGSSIVGSSEN